jgi:hypothetical protein
VGRVNRVNRVNRVKGYVIPWSVHGVLGQVGNRHGWLDTAAGGGWVGIVRHVGWIVIEVCRAMQLVVTRPSLGSVWC